MQKFDLKLNFRNNYSGKTLRKYRQTLAQIAIKKSLDSSDKKSDSTLTIKFKLDCSQTGELPKFENLIFLYDTIEDIKKGTLSYYLFTLIVSGFKFFGSASDAKAFSTKDVFKDNDFYNQFKIQSHLDLPDFVPSKIYKRLKKAVRSTKGKDNAFKASVIAKEYRENIGKLKNKDESSEHQCEELFKKIGTALETRFSNWQDLINNCSIGCEIIDEILNDSFGTLPSIKKMVLASTTQSNDGEQDGIAIAYDPDSTFIKSDELLNPYFAVATILKSMPPEIQQDKKSAYVKDNLTSYKNNALSWIFGKGLTMFQTESTENLCAMFNVSDQRVIEQVQDAAKAIKLPAELGLNHCKLKFQKFRSSLGGHLDSWTTNYLKRLDELNDLLLNLPKNLSLPDIFMIDGKDFIEYSGCNRDEIQQMIDFVVNEQNRIKLQESLNALLGKGNNQICRDDISTVKDFSEIVNSLYSFVQQIDNSLERLSNENSIFSELEENIKNNEMWNIWKNNLNKIPKLNKLSGGVPAAKRELNELEQKFHRITDNCKQHFYEVMEWIKSENITLDIFGSRLYFEEILKNRKKTNSLSADELALRSVLDKIGRFARYGNDQIRVRIKNWFDVHNIFLSKKEFNEYFINLKGTLFKHPFSTKKNHIVKLSPEILNKRYEIIKSIETLLEQCESDRTIIDDPSSMRSLVDFRALWFSIIIRGIEKNVQIPTEVAKPKLDELTYSESVSATLKYRLKKEFITSSELNSIFTVYRSLLSGLSIRLSRNSFYLRTKFLWIGNSSLIYCPKETTWKIPAAYFKSDLWNEYRDKQILIVNEEYDVDVVKTFESVYKIIKSKDNNEKNRILPLLKQLPHDWMFELPFGVSKAEKCKVLKLEKNNEEFKHGSVAKNSLARLSGPSTYFNQIDEIMMNNESALGEMTLLADEPVRQQISEGKVEIIPDDYVMSLAIPITRSLQKGNTESFPFKNIVSIDQGEVGFAYAVFKLSDCGNELADPIATGLIPIPSIRRLIHSVRKYRGKKQRIQNFNQKFDSTMFTLRENVTGDICGLIVALMKKYNAFPVLEKQVGNFQSGPKQLMLVYKSVNSKFLASKVDMQNAQRRSWWYQGDSWKTPVLRISNSNQSNNKNKVKKINGKNYEELKIHPGASVSAYMTSCICHVCGRNALELLKKENSTEKEKKYQINQDGEVTIGGEVIKLYSEPDRLTPVKNLAKNGNRERTYASINERAPWTVSVQKAELSADELQKIIKNNMRRAPRSLMSKDTKQSRYFCVFKNCPCHNKEQHADVNAAINIGRRFLKDCILDDNEDKY
ncbi:MAG: type V CRISPR-associated protein Cas12c [Succinivibrionaceae bacterium]|nr:type V CRISPR-associated protein Cas12c [Succinivibrionaceae bacterium]